MGIVYFPKTCLMEAKIFLFMAFYSIILRYEWKRDVINKYLLAASYFVNIYLLLAILLFFSGINTDPGIWSSFSQLYNLFYGLRDIDQREPYYQAISAMLIPFDKSPYSSGPDVMAPGTNYDKVQKAFARFSKQCRNYCSHNYFGSSI